MTTWGGGSRDSTPLSFPPPPPSSLNPWVSLLPVFNQNSFNDGITHYYYSTRSMKNFNFLKYVLKLLGLQFKQYSVFSESKLSPSQKKFLDPLCIRLSPHDVCLPLERRSALPPYSPAPPLRVYFDFALISFTLTDESCMSTLLIQNCCITNV